MIASRIASVLVTPVAFCAPLAAAVALADEPQVRLAPTEETPSRADRLVAEHRCWTGAAPQDMAGRIPGHVVVTTRDGRTLHSARLVGPALDQLFADADHDLTVHAFCR